MSDDEVRAFVPTWEPGGYVAAYDPDVGVTSLVVTQDPGEALRLSSHDAVALWQSVPAGQPTRLDGRPNRPMSSFTVAIENA